MEFPWELGPPDGRYLLRAQAGGEAEHVVVLATLAAGRRGPGRGRSWPGAVRSGPRTGLRRGRARTAALRPQERFAELLGARGSALMCESFALRARLDLDQSRLALAAIGLEAAFSAATAELPAEQRPDLEIRVA